MARRCTGGRRHVLLVGAAAALALSGCNESPLPDDEKTPARAEAVTRVVEAGEVLEGAQIATMDPSTMVEAEIDAVVSSDERCEFRYTTAGRPVLVLANGPDGRPARGVVKLTGDLVALERAVLGDGAGDAIAVSAGPITMTVRPDAEDQSWTVRDAITRREATMHLRIGDQLDIGYRGYFDCGNQLSAIPYEH